MPNKKGQKQKKNSNQLQGLTVGGTGFNQTKKNLPTLNKLNTQKKSYVSPYSFKAIQKPP